MPRITASRATYSLVIRPQIRWTKLHSIAIVTLLCFLILNNISITGININSTSGSMVKLHHLAAGILILISLKYLKLVHLSAEFLAFSVVGIISALTAMIFHPFNVQILNFAYCLLLTAIFSVAANRFSYDNLVSKFRIAFLIAIAAVSCKNAILWDQIRYLANEGHRVWVDTLVAGGINQEGIVLALGSVFFLRHKLFLPLWTYLIFLNFLYSSRGGILVCVLVLFVYLIGRRITRANFIYLLGGVVILLGIGAFVYTIYSESPIISKVTERFGNIGVDAGSEERLTLWYGSVTAIKENPFGYGVMNGITASSNHTHLITEVENVHNIYLQISLDLGIQSLVIYLWLAASILISTYRQGESNLFGIFITVYLVMGLLRFRAYDPLIFAAIGAFQVYTLYFLSRESSLGVSQRC